MGIAQNTFENIFPHSTVEQILRQAKHFRKIENKDSLKILKGKQGSKSFIKFKLKNIY